MKFSILVPVYNVEQYVEQCIQSVMNQTFQDFELILVDDGSTDNSGKICDKFSELFPEKVQVIHKKNQGLISARRVGISQAKGEFCIFLDSDDFIEDDLLNTVYMYLNKDDKIDICLYSFQYYRNHVKETRKVHIAQDGKVWTAKEKEELYEKLICSTCITSIWTKAIRTSVLKSDSTDYTQYYGKNMAEDLLQSLYPMTAARKICYADKGLYNYRINDESISKSFRPETIVGKNTIHVYEKVKEYLPVWGMDTTEIRQKLSAKWFNDTMYNMCKYYESSSGKARKLVLGFDWKSMLPEEAQSKRNQYENESYQKLYAYLEGKRYMAIHGYFLKKRLYQEIKHLKAKVLKK